MASISTTPRQRTAVRRVFGLDRNTQVPVIVLPGGRMPPRKLGRGYYHTTLSGKTIVHHPNAYGWPTLYHPSTRRIVVGELWVRENANA